MSDSNDEARTGRSEGWLGPGPNNITLIYVLYLVGLVIGVSALVGIVLAYINRGKSEAWVETHYTWAIRTFWIGILYSIISAVLMVVGIGFLLFIVVAVWLVVRCVVGLQQVHRREAIRNPESWII